MIGRDDEAIITEIERSEEQLKDHFQQALADDTLSPAGRAAAAQAWQSISTGHDEMRALKLTENSFSRARE